MHYPPKASSTSTEAGPAGTVEPLAKGLPQRPAHVNVLREWSAADRLDPCGVLSAHRRPGVRPPDGGDHWKPIVRDLPSVMSVEVQTLA